MNQDTSLYTSKRQLKNLWQTYRIFSNRIELKLRPFGCIIIPFAQIAKIEKRSPLVVLDLFRGKTPIVEMIRTLKLDFADFYVHLDIEKRAGFWRHFRFTPDHPDTFLAEYQRAYRKFSTAAGRQVSE